MYVCGLNCKCIFHSTCIGFDISIKTILRCRKQLGWTYRGSAYCQMIRAVNKEKRLEWAREYLCESEDGFGDVIFSDESTIQLETHRRYCYRKKGCAAKRKPRLGIIIMFGSINFAHVCNIGLSIQLKSMYGLV